MIALGSKVKIVPLEGIEGRITSIWIMELGIKYDVRYFHQGKAEQVYFFEDELEVI